jgi:hypothetical protein
VSTRRTFHLLLGAAWLALTALVVVFNVVNLSDPQGETPSHENSPREILIAVDAVAILIGAWSLHLLIGRKSAER